MKAWISLISILYLSLLHPIQQVYGDEYKMPINGDDIVGQSYTVKVEKGESLTTIRKKHGVSYDGLLDANPSIDFYKLKVGDKIIIPKQFILPKFRRGIVINIPELRLYYFTPDGEHVYTFPVGLGRENWRTPLSSSKVIKKKEDPIWFVPDSIRNYVQNKTGELLPNQIPPGPKNPLGKYALYLNKSGYLIHGTNAPNSVGTFISSGCMRLLREPIETLYHKVPIGTQVHIIHHPYKAGWLGDKLYLESHKPIDSYTHKETSPLNNNDFQEAIHHAIHLQPAKINWNLVSRNSKEDLGIPKQIGHKLSFAKQI